jgi:hypothetical protein
LHGGNKRRISLFISQYYIGFLGQQPGCARHIAISRSGDKWRFSRYCLVINIYCSR